MANTTSRTVDFAPAWLKLTDDGQEQRKSQPVSNNHPNNQHYNPQQPLRQNSITIPKYTVVPPNPSHQRHRRPVNRSLSDQGPRIITNYKPRPRQNLPNKQEARHQNPAQYQQNPPPHPAPHANNPHQTVPRQQAVKPPAVAAPPKPVPVKPVEDFPSLGGKPSVSSSIPTPAPTVQWKAKQTSEQRSQSESDTAANAQNGNAQSHLLSNKSGKMFRAHVKPIPKRTPIMPTKTEEHTDTGEVFHGEMNGVVHNIEEEMEQSVVNGTDNIDDLSDHEEEKFDNVCVKTPVISIPSTWMSGGETNLSSSVEKEKRLLQAMGWKEEDSDIEDDCIIPEQTPAQLEALFKEREERRRTLLLKSKQMSLKPRVKPVFTAANNRPITEQYSSHRNNDGE